MRARFGFLLGALVLTLATLAAPAAATPPLGHQGRWLVDPQGRVVVLHGFNMVAKVAPYDPAALGFGEDDARFLAAHGFTTVRLGLVLTGLEPTPGGFDDRYLAGVKGTVDLLGTYGIKTLLQFPVELYNRQFLGQGYPDWMVRTDGVPNIFTGSIGESLLLNPALQRATDNFWSNATVYGKGLQDWFAAAWGHAARSFAGDPAVLGYDLYNEPWPGTRWPVCLPPLGCKDFDQRRLVPFYRKVFAAVRAVDRAHLVFYEPNVMAAEGAPTYLGRLGDSRAVESFHMYCPDISGQPIPDFVYTACHTVQDFVIGNAESQAAAGGDGIFLTEFGATGSAAELAHAAQRADQAMISWQEWTYCRCKDPSQAGTVEGLVYDTALPPAGANVNMPALKALDEPYPRAVAGIPRSYGFDPATGTFTLRFTPQGSAVTEVWTSPLQYPAGYHATVTGARITSAPGAAVLTLRTTPGSSEVTLSLSR